MGDMVHACVQNDYFRSGLRRVSMLDGFAIGHTKSYMDLVTVRATLEYARLVGLGGWVA